MCPCPDYPSITVVTMSSSVNHAIICYHYHDPLWIIGGDFSAARPGAGEPNLISSWQVRRCFAPGIGWLWGFQGELWTIGEGLKVGPGTHGGSPTCRYFLFKDPHVCKCAVPLIFGHTSLFFWFLLAFCCLYPRPFLLPDSCRTHMSHPKNPGNTKYVLDGHWLWKLMEIITNTR